MDHLLECLAILTKMNHRPLSETSLAAGLPLVNHQLTPPLFIRAAERAGFMAKMFHRDFNQISPLLLPAVLLLKNNQACILCGFNEDKTVQVILPEAGDTVINKTHQEIESVYTGNVIFVQPVVTFEARSDLSQDKSESSHWFWGVLWKYHYIYFQVILAALFINIFNLVSPLFVMNVYDRVVPNFAETTLWVLVIGILIIYLFDFVLRNLRSYLIDVCGKKADVLMASVLFQQVLGMEMSSKPASTGAFVNYLRDFEILRDFFTSATLTTLIDVPFVILFFVLTAYIGGSIVWVPLTIVPLVLLCAYYLEKPLRASVAQATHGAMQKHAILVETMTALETIKCLGAEGQMQKKWEQYVSSSAKAGLKSRFFSGLVINITQLAQQLVTVGVVAWGVYAIHANTLTVGGLIACSIISGRIIAPLAQLANLLTRFQQAKMALTGLNEFMMMPVERPIKKQFLHLTEWKGDIEFEEVTFQYPGQQTLALDRFSFKMKAGERIALIGRIGSGKSTVQKLLLGLYTPQSGRIRIDGIDISQIDPAELRRKIGYVPQESILFYGDVRSNIAMSMPTAEDSEIVEAAKMAGIDRYIHQHPQGYAMPIGERGEGLSGGQRQMLAIARTLLAKPAIWLFDEPTSAMDNTSEMELVHRLAMQLQNKTVMMVTHRTSLFPLVDRLLVLDGGRLLMDGHKDKVLGMLTEQPHQRKSASEEKQHAESTPT